MFVNMGGEFSISGESDITIGLIRNRPGIEYKFEIK